MSEEKQLWLIDAYWSDKRFLPHPIILTSESAEEIPGPVQVLAAFQREGLKVHKGIDVRYYKLEQYVAENDTRDALIELMGQEARNRSLVEELQRAAQQVANRNDEVKRLQALLDKATRTKKR